MDVTHVNSAYRPGEPDVRAGVTREYGPGLQSYCAPLTH